MVATRIPRRQRRPDVAAANRGRTRYANLEELSMSTGCRWLGPPAHRMGGWYVSVWTDTLLQCLQRVLDRRHVFRDPPLGHRTVVSTLRSAPAIRPGIGIYARADAARLLGMTPGRLRRWVGGYTYWLRETSAGQRQRRRQRPVVHTELPTIGSAVALSFLELMELRVVKALVDEGVSLQHVRAAARLAAERFHTHHPFASSRVFTDGRHIFSAVTDEVYTPDVVKWTRDAIDQVVAGPVFDQFLHEIDFDPSTALAQRWWPLGRDTPIVLDPAISFGAPVVVGTGVRTATVARLARGSSIRDAAVAYEIELGQARAAVEFEQTLAAA